MIANARYIVGIALFVIIAILGFTVVHYRQAAQLAEAETQIVTERLAIVTRANADNVATIGRITKMREQNDKLLRDITETLDTINSAQAETTAALTELKANDTDARTYLDSPIPDSVKRLLAK